MTEAEQERADVVAYLMKDARLCYETQGYEMAMALECAAGAIRNGNHLTGDTNAQRPE